MRCCLAPNTDKAPGVREMALPRAYLLQWICSRVWDMNPRLTDQGRIALDVLRERVRRAVTVKEVRQCISTMTSMGMNPL